MSWSVSLLQYYTISILFTKRGVAEHANNTCNAFCNERAVRYLSCRLDVNVEESLFTAKMPLKYQ